MNVDNVDKKELKEKIQRENDKKITKAILYSLALFLAILVVLLVFDLA